MRYLIFTLMLAMGASACQHSTKGAPNPLPLDVQKRLKEEYPADKQYKSVTKLLAAMYSNPGNVNGAQLVRCIVFLANGDETQLREYLRMAEVDPRDVLAAGERATGKPATEFNNPLQK